MRHTEDGREPSELGYFLLNAMANAGFKRQAHLARAAGLSQSTLSRLVYGLVDRPDSETLHQLSNALDLNSDDKLTLRNLAGHPDAPRRPLSPRALKLDALIGENSPLSSDDQRYLCDMFDRLVAPYEDQLRRHSA